MQLSNFFVKTSTIQPLGLNRFMYYENATGRLVSPAVPNIYIVFIKDGHGSFNNKQLRSGDVFAYGFNMHPLTAEIQNLTFLGVELEFQLFHQITNLLPAFCQDVLLFDSQDRLRRFFNQRLLYFPPQEWLVQIEEYICNLLSYHTKGLDSRTQRLIYATTTILTKNYLNLDSLANDLNISYRALQRDFSGLLGITPKQYQSVHRVYAAAEYIKFNKLNDAAILAGYTDQAHMNRDFKRFTGITPYQVNITHQKDSKLYVAADTKTSDSSAFIVPY